MCSWSECWWCNKKKKKTITLSVGFDFWFANFEFASVQIGVQFGIQKHTPKWCWWHHHPSWGWNHSWWQFRRRRVWKCSWGAEVCSVYVKGWISIRVWIAKIQLEFIWWMVDGTIDIWLRLKVETIWSMYWEWWEVWGKKNCTIDTRWGVCVFRNACVVSCVVSPIKPEIAFGVCMWIRCAYVYGDCSNIFVTENAYVIPIMWFYSNTRLPNNVQLERMLMMQQKKKKTYGRMTEGTWTRPLEITRMSKFIRNCRSGTSATHRQRVRATSTV